MLRNVGATTRESAMPGFQELLVIMVVALVAVGPERLPKAARDIAKVFARLQREAHVALRDLKAEANAEGLGTELRQLRRDLADPGASAVEADTEVLDVGAHGDDDMPTDPPPMAADPHEPTAPPETPTV